MSKRLNDTEIWKKSWFYDLDLKYKLFWFYILADCDAAGIWPVNLKLAENILRFKIDHDDVLKLFGEQIFVLNGGKYWIIIDFIKFQYGYPISDKSPMRKKLVDLLSSKCLNLDTLYENSNTLSIQYKESSNTVKDKDKDKEEDKDKDKEEDKERIKNEIILPFESENFKNIWNQWKEYKSKEFGFKYKSSQSEQAALKELSGIADNEKMAVDIIIQSMANGYKGLFKLKINGKSNSESGSEKYIRKAAEYAAKRFGTDNQG
jgi:hypothetical protein